MKHIYEFVNIFFLSVGMYLGQTTKSLAFYGIDSMYGKVLDNLCVDLVLQTKEKNQGLKIMLTSKENEVMFGSNKSYLMAFLYQGR